MDLSDELGPIAFLLGTWAGEGTATYPTMDQPVAYREQLEFDHVKDPFLRYGQESWTLDGGPLHFERGFWRVRNGSVEVILAHANGLVEIAHGTAQGPSVQLSSEGAVSRAATGSAVTGLRRRYRVERDELIYEVDMAMDEVDMTMHLEGRARRT